MIKKFLKFIIELAIALVILYMLYTNRSIILKKTKETIKNSGVVENTVINISEIDNPQNEVEEDITITLIDLDGNGTNYSFKYHDATFYATYTPDNWHIENSYKIKNTSAIRAVCEALIKVHQIHGKDMVSYRTVDDLTYEWIQHNLAYEYLPEDNVWRKSAKHVDLNPEDQGLSFEQIYESITGEKLNDKIKSKIKKIILE